MEIKSKTSTWYVCAVTIDRLQDNGLLVTKKENHIVEAFTPSEAEEIILKELAPETNGELLVKSSKEEAFKEYITIGEEEYDYWYKAKVALVAVDEATVKEKRTNVIYLINAPDFVSATEMVTAFFKTSMAEYDIVSVVKTNIVSVVEK